MIKLHLYIKRNILYNKVHTIDITMKKIVETEKKMNNNNEKLVKTQQCPSVRIYIEFKCLGSKSIYCLSIYIHCKVEESQV